MKILQIKETCLYVRDLQLTEQFYTTLLEFEMLQKVEGRHIFYRAGTSVLLFFLPEATKSDLRLPTHYGYGEMHIAFEVRASDYVEWKKFVERKNITIIHEHTWKKDLRSFYFRDPDQHLLEIVSEGMWDR